MAKPEHTEREWSALQVQHSATCIKECARAKILRSHKVTQAVAVEHHLCKAKLQHIHVLARS